MAGYARVLGRATPMTLTVGLAMLASLDAGCSLLLDWDDTPSRQPCDDQQRCKDGYSCLGVECVKDDTIDLGQTCKFDQQCVDNLVCSPKPFFACRVGCSQFYTSPGACAAGEYCRPFKPYRDLENEWKGACVPPSKKCNDDLDCCDGNVGCPDICVTISAAKQANACVKGCSPSFSGGYSDGCTTGTGDVLPEYCTPIGDTDRKRLVCLEADPATAQSEGGLCESVTKPCGRGLSCEQPNPTTQGLCRSHCDTDTDECTGGTSCKPRTLDNDASYGICEE